MVTAIVVKVGDKIIQSEMFVMGEGLKTIQEMKKYRHVNYQTGLYYDKQTGEVVDMEAKFKAQAKAEALRTHLREGIINSNPFLRALRRG